MNRALLFVIALSVSFTLTAPVYAQGAATGRADELLTTVQEQAVGNTDPVTVDEIAGNVIAIALSMVGVIFIVLIIYGGYLWGTARGNEERVERGKKLLIEAVIGIIIIFTAYFVTAFVLQQLGYATIESRQFWQ